MADMENELKDLREKNTELVQKVQYWKMTAAQRENEKLELMKEVNDLRLKLSRLRSGGAAQARKLDAALQTASEEALAHLVQASSAVARTLELAKTYMQDRQELDSALPRWSTLSNTPSTERVNIVPPMLIGGRLIQPVVSLSRTLHTNNSRSVSRSPNVRNRSASERALPLHMLQDVYIPLTRIDAGDFPINTRDTDMEVNHADESTEDLGLDDSTERAVEEHQNVTEGEEFEESRRLDAVTEDVEPEDGLTPERSRMDNPLEGPSWLLDRPSSKSQVKSSSNFEPDSTTEFEDNTPSVEPGPSGDGQHERVSALAMGVGADVVSVFSPTVRRRRRSSPPPSTPQHTVSPHFSPRPARRYSNNGRILKVLVAKMRLDDEPNEATPPKRPRGESPIPEPVQDSAEESSSSPTGRDISPSKRLMRFDAPSPNGSTDSRVIVLEAKINQPEAGCSGVSRRKGNRTISTDSQNPDNQSRQSDSQANNSDRCSRDSDSSGGELASGGRTRRARKAIVYKEKPLNRKLRR